MAENPCTPRDVLIIMADSPIRNISDPGKAALAKRHVVYLTDSPRVQ